MAECNDKVISSRRKTRPKRLEFIGWGSRRLIEFLESLGIDTTSKISEYEVTTILGKYFKDKNLFHPLKKKRKRIVCDESLLSLFGSKTICRNKVHDLIAKHYADNQDDPYFDFLYGTEDEQRRCFQSDLKVNKTRQVVENPKAKGTFAAIVSDNIKLLYLKRSLVQELVKVPDTFEGKMVGTFVRIKSDPNDYLQKNPYQLVQVTGVKEEHQTDGYLLQVTNYLKDVPISMLSDDNFSQEECEDLHQRIKNGFLKRPKVVEMEEKVRSLHEDVTKHWLARELILLQRLIDQANEKGWRRELSEYLEKRELLKNPEEQSRILREVPEVSGEEPGCVEELKPECVEELEAECVEELEPECVEELETECVEELEPECLEELGPECLEELGPDCVDEHSMEDFTAPIPLASTDAHQSDKEQHLSDSPISSAPEVMSPDMTVNGMLPTLTDSAGNKDLHEDVDEPPANDITYDPSKFIICEPERLQELGPECVDEHSMEDFPAPIPLASTAAYQSDKEQHLSDSPISSIQDTPELPKLHDAEEHKSNKDVEELPVNGITKIKDSVTKVSQHQSSNPLSDLNNVPQTQPKQLEVIELSSDDDNDEDEGDNYNLETLDSIQQYDVQKLMWFYEYPKGQTQGPFSLTQLKEWNDDEYFLEVPDFKVWRTGQDMKSAVLLSRLLSNGRT